MNDAAYEVQRMYNASAQVLASVEKVAVALLLMPGDPASPAVADAYDEAITAICHLTGEKRAVARDRMLRRGADVGAGAPSRATSAPNAGFLGGTWSAPGELYETVVAYSLPDARMAVIGVTVHDGSGPHGSRACAPAELEELAARLNAPIPAGVRESAPETAPDPHVSYVPGEDPGIAALREMVNGNRRFLGVDGDGGGEER